MSLAATNTFTISKFEDYTQVMKLISVPFLRELTCTGNAKKSKWHFHLVPSAPSVADGWLVCCSLSLAIVKLISRNLKNGGTYVESPPPEPH